MRAFSRKESHRGPETEDPEYPGLLMFGLLRARQSEEFNMSAVHAVKSPEPTTNNSYDGR